MVLIAASRILATPKNSIPIANELPEPKKGNWQLPHWKKAMFSRISLSIMFLGYSRIFIKYKKLAHQR